MVHSRRSALLLLLGYIAAQTLLPWKALALLPLGYAAVESGRAILAFAASSNKGGRGAVMWTVLGTVLIGLTMTSVIVPYFFYDSMKAYQDCMLGANTSVASARCQSVLRGSIEPLLRGYVGG